MRTISSSVFQHGRLTNLRQKYNKMGKPDTFALLISINILHGIFVNMINKKKISWTCSFGVLKTNLVWVILRRTTKTFFNLYLWPKRPAANSRTFHIFTCNKFWKPMHHCPFSSQPSLNKTRGHLWPAGAQTDRRIPESRKSRIFAR